MNTDYSIRKFFTLSHNWKKSGKFAEIQMNSVLRMINIKQVSLPKVTVWIENWKAIFIYWFGTPYWSCGNQTINPNSGISLKHSRLFTSKLIWIMNRIQKKKRVSKINFLYWCYRNSSQNSLHNSYSKHNVAIRKITITILSIIIISTTPFNNIEITSHRLSVVLFRSITWHQFQCH